MQEVMHFSWKQNKIWKPFFFETVLNMCTDEWIFSRKIPHCNLTAKTDTDVPGDLRHFAYKLQLSLISMQKTLFYTSNATSTFMTVVFSINCSQTFALSYVRCVAILNWKLHTTQKQVSTSNHQKHYLCSDRYICTTQQSSSFFSAKFCMKFKNIFLIIQILLICCKIWRLTKLFFRKQRKRSRFSTTPSTSRDTSWLTGFPGYMVFVYKHQKVHCNGFPGYMVCICLQTSNGTL